MGTDTTIRFIFTDPTIMGVYRNIAPARLSTFLACDRININDGTGQWHSADVVRRIYDVSDGLLTIVLAD
jgi:hypothetical protein